MSDNLQYFGIITESGSIYANGQYLFEDSIIGTNTGDTFNWKRTHDFQTGTDYSYLNMEVQNVIPDKIEGPTFYHSAYASSENVMLIFCDIGTTWVYTESKPFTMVDVFGRKTPRQLDFLDAESFELHDRYHILAYDINTDQVIDFFSPLNAFYFTGAEPDPVNGITTAFTGSFFVKRE